VTATSIDTDDRAGRTWGAYGAHHFNADDLLLLVDTLRVLVDGHARAADRLAQQTKGPAVRLLLSPEEAEALSASPTLDAALASPPRPASEEPLPTQALPSIRDHPYSAPQGGQGEYLLGTPPPAKSPHHGGPSHTPSPTPAHGPTPQATPSSTPAHGHTLRAPPPKAKAQPAPPPPRQAPPPSLQPRGSTDGAGPDGVLPPSLQPSGLTDGSGPPEIQKWILINRPVPLSCPCFRPVH
jgi:hypothetical protein